MSGESEGVSAAWDARAHQWAAWARTPGVDVFFSELNWPTFLELLPAPGRRTLDVGCGEGRVGRELAAVGHRVAGIDSSESLVSLARDAGGYEELVCRRAEHLPWTDDSFDLAIAFMSLHDMDDPVAVIEEIARVLVPGGLLCVATVHPLNRSRGSLADYFAEHRVAETVEHEGIEMTFEMIDRPLETYTRALAEAGFVVEELREPRPPWPVESQSPLAKALTAPFFVHLRCRLPIDVRSS